MSRFKQYLNEGQGSLEGLENAFKALVIGYKNLQAESRGWDLSLTDVGEAIEELSIQIDGKIKKINGK